MAKLLVVFGATGKQGGSIITHVLTDPVLSNEYTIRAVTRDPSSPPAQALSNRGISIATADVTSAPSLPAAVRGAHTVFGLTAPSFGPGAKEKELASGKALADAAVAAGAAYLVFSVLPHVSTVSGGKYTRVVSFDAQAEVADYIRTLPIKSAFFSPGSFMANFHGVMAPRPAGDGSGSYVMARHVAPEARLPLIDTSGDTGKFVGAILAEPERYEGKTVCAAGGIYSMDEMAGIIGAKTGKVVKYRQVSVEAFRERLGGADLPWVETLVQMMSYQEEYGYWGPGTEREVEWAVENARGTVSGLEGYLEREPLQLK